MSLVSERPGLIITRKDDAWFIVNASCDKVGTVADAALTARIRQLAWFHRLSWRKDTSNPFTLALEQAAAERGNINRLGERISFDIRPERDAWLVILYVDPGGVMAPFYPWQSAETAPLKGGEKVRIPADDSLEVREPLGTDLVIALGYSERPAFLDSIVGATTLPPDSALNRDILASSRDEQTVAVATLELQTVPPAP